MISIECDICGDIIFSGAMASDKEITRAKPQFNTLLYQLFGHVCPKCMEVYKALDVKNIIESTILLKREDIPREADSESKI